MNNNNDSYQDISITTTYINFGKRKVTCILTHPTTSFPAKSDDVTTNARCAVIMLSGTGGGYHGPGNMYHKIAPLFASRGIYGVQLTYRRPNQLEECIDDVRDVLDSMMHLDYKINRAVLIGMYCSR